MKYVLYISFFALLILVSCDSLRKAGSTEAYAFSYSSSTTDPSLKAFLQTHFDSVMICVDPVQKLQVMKWQTLTEKYFLISRKGESTLVIDDYESVESYSGPELKELLPQFDYFSFEKGTVSEMKHHDMECDAISFEQAGSGKNQLFRKGEDNELPLFPDHLGTPILFYAKGCNNQFVDLMAGSPFKPNESDFKAPASRSTHHAGSRVKSDVQMYVHGQIQYKPTSQPIGNSHVVVWRGGVLDTLVVADCDGRYAFTLEGPAVYNLYYHGGDLAGKNILFDLENLPEDAGEFEMQLDGVLFDVPAGCTYDFTAEPIAIARYFPDFGEIQFDFEHSEMMAAKLDSVLQVK